jgi:hypothetical protein
MATTTTLTARTAQGSRPWGTAFAVFACGVGAFQLALVVGAPWGTAAWGGGSSGTLPVGLRVASALAALVWGAVAAVSAGRLLGPVGRRRLLLGAAVYSTIGIAMNAISPSSTERAVWVPLTALGAGLSWMAWRESRRRP